MASPHSGLTGADLHNVKQHNHDADTEAGGGRLSGAVVDTFVDVAEAAAPGTPAAAHVRLYAKSDGLLYQKDDAGLETGLAGGGSLADHNHTAAGGDGGDLDGAAVGDFLEFAEVAAPSTPAAGLVRLYAKADGSFYQKDDAGTETGLAGGGGSGATIHDEAYGSPPASDAAGDLWLPTDSFYALRRNDGDTAWVPHGPVHPLTLPVDGDFAWINQGGASVDATKGAIYLLAPAVAGDQLRIRKKAAPATPYTITACLQPLGLATGSCGLLFREAATGEIHTLMVVGGTTAGTSVRSLFVTKYASASLFSANYTTFNLALTVTSGTSPTWLRIADDGTNRICSISTDGQNWIVVHTIGRTDFLTADEVGFFANSNNASNAVGITLLSWKAA